MFTASSGYERRRAAMETDGGAGFPNDTAIAARVLEFITRNRLDEECAKRLKALSYQAQARVIRAIFMTLRGGSGR